MATTVEAQADEAGTPSAATQWSARARAKREHRYARSRMRRAGMIPSAGAATCQHAAPTAAEVVVTVDAEGQPHVSSIQRCANVWCCPVCAPIVRQRRAVEIDQAVSVALAKGMHVVFVTATIPHYANDSLRDSFGDVVGSWSSMWSGRRGAVLRKGLAMVGQVRAVEATYGIANGWHPHVHALLFLDGGPSTQSIASKLKQEWSRTVIRRTGRPPHEAIGLTVSEVKESGEVSKYLAKVDGGWGAGLELARADVKLAAAGRWTPPQLLAEAADNGEAWAVYRWCEWENVTYRRRAIQWTPGLRSKLGLDEELTDEELAAIEPAQPVYSRRIPVETWEAFVNAGREWELIADVIDRAHDLGYFQPPPEPDEPPPD